MHVRGKDIYVEADDNDLYAAIDDLIDKLDRQGPEVQAEGQDHHRSDKGGCPQRAGICRPASAENIFDLDYRRRNVWWLDIFNKSGIHRATDVRPRKLGSNRIRRGVAIPDIENIGHGTFRGTDAFKPDFAVHVVPLARANRFDSSSRAWL